MTGIPYLACRNHNLNDKQKGMDVWIVFNAINITCDNWDLLLIGWTGGWMGGLYSVVARTPDPEWCAKHQCSYAQYISLLWLFLTEGRSRAGCPFLFIISLSLKKNQDTLVTAYRHTASDSKKCEWRPSMTIISWCLSRKHSTADSGVRAILHLNPARSQAHQKASLWLSSLANTSST